MSRDGQWIQGAATTPQTGQNETVAYVAHVCDDDIGGPCSTTGAAPFTLGASPNQLTVAAGRSGTSTITVTPNAGFTQPVSFSCGNLPIVLTPAGLILIGGHWYRRRADAHSLWMALLLTSVIAMVSCGSDDSPPPATNSGGGVPATGTPAGTSTITVTASSGGNSTGVPITLNVTRQITAM